MLTRRHCLSRLGAIAAGAIALPLLGACGGAEDDDVDPGAGSSTTGATTAPPASSGEVVGTGGVAEVSLERAAPDAAAVRPAVQALTDFTADLERILSAQEGNLVSSPYSVMVALAMTRTGGLGQTATEIDTVLHAPTPAPDALNAGLNALAQTLEARAGSRAREDGSNGEIALDVANALWGQEDTEFEQPFLEALARYYAAGMRLVDYKTDPEGARQTINAWVAEQTHDKIRDLIPAGVIKEITRLVLTNAIYLKAPWEDPFAPAESTDDAPFTLLDGTVKQVPMMYGGGEHVPYAAAEGVQRVTLPYVGRELAMTVIVPDAGRFAEVEKGLDGATLASYLVPGDPRMVSLRLPRFRYRLKTGLVDALTALGMPTAFTGDADFSGITTEEPILIGDVIHEAFIAVDEEGTEAAAATAVVMEAGAAAPTEEPVELVVDRPFLYVIHDIATAAPLFIGRVVDPVEAS